MVNFIELLALDVKRKFDVGGVTKHLTDDEVLLSIFKDKTVVESFKEDGAHACVIKHLIKISLGHHSYSNVKNRNNLSELEWFLKTFSKEFTRLKTRSLRLYNVKKISYCTMDEVVEPLKLAAKEYHVSFCTGEFTICNENNEIIREAVINLPKECKQAWYSLKSSDNLNLNSGKYSIWIDPYQPIKGTGSEFLNHPNVDKNIS